MKHFLVSLLVGFWLLGPHAFGAVNARNGVSITTASTINGRTPNSAINGQTITAGGGGSPAVIANTGQAGTANGVTTGTINTTGANLIVVNAAWYSAGAADVTISDSEGNTGWSETTTRASSLVSNRIYYKYSPTTGASHTFTLTGTNSYPSVQVIAFSNIAASPFDQQNGSTTGGAWTTTQPGSITPSQANTVVVVGLTFETNSSGTISINGGYTISNSTAHGSGANEGGSLAYQIFTSASAQNPTWTTSSSSTDGATNIVSFKY